MLCPPIKKCRNSLRFRLIRDNQSSVNSCCVNILNAVVRELHSSRVRELAG